MTQIPDPIPSHPIPPQTPVDDRPHREADDREEVYFHGSPMLRGQMGLLFGCWVAALILLAIPIFMKMNGHGPHMIVWLVCIALAIIIASLPIPITRRESYRISNYRIDFERGLLS